MQLREGGADVRTVQLWMGHRSLESTLEYLKPARDKEIQAKVENSPLAKWGEFVRTLGFGADSRPIKRCVGDLQQRNPAATSQACPPADE